MHKNMVLLLKKKKLSPPYHKTYFFCNMKLFFFLRNLHTPNSSAMACSRRKEFRTGLRIVVAFFKVKLQPLCKALPHESAVPSEGG